MFKKVKALFRPKPKFQKRSLKKEYENVIPPQVCEANFFNGGKVDRSKHPPICREEQKLEKEEPQK